MLKEIRSTIQQQSSKWRKRNAPSWTSFPTTRNELVDLPGRAFTVVEYRGPDAKKAIKQDLAMLMSELTLNGPQMYGYNLSTIPSILLHNGLIASLLNMMDIM
ncbi:hypothetical protein PM082_009984 [Marasmius tenuissimus]|nr:hypothetical protein PM082_009984 [Marasmius tenuissimus]